VIVNKETNMKKIIIALTSILAFPVLAQTIPAAPTATIPAATTTITTVPLKAGTETTTTTTTTTLPQQAMEEAPSKELSPSREPVEENLIAPSLQQREEVPPQFKFETEEDEYVPGNQFFNYNEEDDEY
jgi:hypothetical protein